MKLSPQKEIIVSTLRDMKWHCGREWVDRIKDDRIRITELNRGYMAEKGFVIKGEPCKGSACGRAGCPLFKRRAERIHPLHGTYLPRTATLPNETAQTAPQLSYKGGFPEIKPLFAIV